MPIEMKADWSFELYDTSIHTATEGDTVHLAYRPALKNIYVNLVRLAVSMAILVLAVSIEKLGRGRSGSGLLLLLGVVMLVGAVAARFYYYRYHRLALGPGGLMTWSQVGPLRLSTRTQPPEVFDRLSATPSPSGGAVLVLVTKDQTTRLVEANRRVWAERAADVVNEHAAGLAVRSRTLGT